MQNTIIKGKERFISYSFGTKILNVTMPEHTKCTVISEGQIDNTRLLAFNKSENKVMLLLTDHYELP